jgi:hypothetical protein
MTKRILIDFVLLYLNILLSLVFMIMMISDSTNFDFLLLIRYVIVGSAILSILSFLTDVLDKIFDKMSINTFFIILIVLLSLNIIRSKPLDFFIYIFALNIFLFVIYILILIIIIINSIFILKSKNKNNNIKYMNCIIFIINWITFETLLMYDLWNHFAP